MEREFKKRTQYFIVKRFQSRQALLFVAASCLTATVIAWATFTLIQNYEALLNKIGAAELPLFQTQWQRQLRVTGLLWFGYACSVSVMLTALVIYLSHRVAGPIFSIGRRMRNYPADRQTPLALRRTDKLQDIAELFNSFMSSDIARRRAEVSRLSTVVADLTSSPVSEKNRGLHKAILYELEGYQREKTAT